ncbi:hypothetical protein GGF43_001451 [Coemansia sp. RSA 2618]|nr:hypothetical protein GGF43_001451 [Coemansia sp. RSA 2618]
MTTHPMDRPPSDIEVDLSSDAGSEGRAGDARAEAEASQLLRSTKLSDFGSAAANVRRMDFSPTPSPPPAAQGPAYTQGPAYAQGYAPSHHGQQGLAQQQQTPAAGVFNGGAGVFDATNISSSSPYTAAPALAAAVAAGNGRDDSDTGSMKEGSVESTAVPPASPSVGTPSARSRTSIWVHFTRDQDYATNRRGRCVYCHNYYSCSSGSTGNMWRHIKRSHPEKAMHAAPLATHGAHSATPLQVKSEGDSRPRKRQASLSSPTADRVGSSPAQRAVPSGAARADDGGLGDGDGDSADGLLHALRLLMTLTGRPADRPAGPASSALVGLLDQLHALRSDGEAGAVQQQQQRQPRHAQAAQRGSGGLATIPEAASMAMRADGPVAVDPASINQFVAAISDALRTNAEAASGVPGGRAQRAVGAYVDFMVRELVGVERVLSPGMQGLMAGVAQGAAVPTAAELEAEVFRRRDAAAEALRRRLLDTAGGKVSVSLSTGRVAGTRHYLAVHAHWADAALVRHDALLDWRCVDGAATSGDIIAAFEGTLTRFGLFARLGAVTTNYTREFVEFLNQAETICHARGASFDLDRSQATCVAHTLLGAQNKLLGLLLAGAGAGATPLAKLRAALQGLLAAGAPGAQELVELCRGRGVDISTLEYDDARAWDSTQAQLGGALSVFAELSVLVGGTAHALAPDEWLWLSQAHVLLGVVSVAVDALVRLPSDFPSIVDVVPIYDTLADNLQGLLQTPGLCDGIRHAGSVMREYVAQSHPFQASPIYRLAPLFDPRLKMAYYADRGHDQAWVARVQREARSLLAEHAQPNSSGAVGDAVGAQGDMVGTQGDMATQGAVDSSSSSSAFAQVPVGADMKTTIDSFIQLGGATAQLAADGRARVFRRAFASGRSELDDYLAAPLAAPSVPPLPWWHVHHTAFPALAHLAREYLSISAASSPVSMLFRRPNALDYSLVANLDKKLADAYICLHHWQQ